MHLQISSAVTDEDDYIEDILIPAGRERGESATNRQWITATWDLKLRSFPMGTTIRMPKPPLLTVSSITYVDSNGTTQTLASSRYSVRTYAGPKAQNGFVELAYGDVWPTTRAQEDAVTIRFTCGYGATAASVPTQLRRALLVDIASMYEPGRKDLVVGSISQQHAFNATVHGIYWGFRSHPVH